MTNDLTYTSYFKICKLELVFFYELKQFIDIKTIADCL